MRRLRLSCYKTSVYPFNCIPRLVVNILFTILNEDIYLKRNFSHLCVNIMKIIFNIFLPQHLSFQLPVLHLWTDTDENIWRWLMIKLSVSFCRMKNLTLIRGTQFNIKSLNDLFALFVCNQETSNELLFDVISPFFRPLNHFLSLYSIN